MSFGEPPRLRTLQQELPRDLLLALEDMHRDGASSAELDALSLSVEKALRATESARASVRSLRSPAKRSRVAAVVFMFAIGAAAGVAGSSAVFYVISPSAAPSRANSAPPGRPQPRASLPPMQVAEPLGTPEQPVEADPVPASVPREAARSPVKSPAAEAPPESSSRPAPGSREEFALLARAQAALASNPGSALALTSDHERNFPNGALIQERELVAIGALLRLGRRAEASARAARFHQQFPTSVHGRRIDVLLGNADSSTDRH